MHGTGEASPGWVHDTEPSFAGEGLPEDDALRGMPSPLHLPIVKRMRAFVICIDKLLAGVCKKEERQLRCGRWADVL